MMKPFQEHGNYVAMHKGLFDELMLYISPGAWKVLCYIIRHTDGSYPKKEFRQFTYDQLMAGTGYKQRKAISRAIQELLIIGVITRKPIPSKKKAMKDSFTYGLNQKFDTEVISSQREPDTSSTSSQKELDTSSQKELDTSSQKELDTSSQKELDTSSQKELLFKQEPLNINNHHQHEPGQHKNGDSGGGGGGNDEIKILANSLGILEPKGLNQSHLPLMNEYVKWTKNGGNYGPGAKDPGAITKTRILGNQKPPEANYESNSSQSGRTKKPQSDAGKFVDELFKRNSGSKA
jgi:hypothetical protein